MHQPGKHLEKLSSPDDIRSGVLASELGVVEYRLPDEHYQQADLVLQELISGIVADMVKSPVESWGDFLLDHEIEIFRIFDRFPSMWRFPLLLTRKSVFHHVTIEAHLLNANIDLVGNAFLNCMYFYLHLRAHKKLREMIEKHTIVPASINAIQQVVDDEGRTEIESAWGIRYGTHIVGLLGERGQDRMHELLSYKPFRIPTGFRDEYRRRKLAHWKQKGLPPERIFLNVVAMMERDNHMGSTDLATNDPFHFLLKQGETIDIHSQLHDELDVDAMCFLFCQNHTAGYVELIRGMKDTYDHMATWKIWIFRFIHLLKKRDSETFKLFCYIFELEGDIFALQAGQLTREAQRKLPDQLHDVLLEADQKYRIERKNQRKQENVRAIVQRIPVPPLGSTAMARMVTRPALPAKETVPAPKIDILFVDHEVAKKSKKQLTKIDLSSCHFPEGTQIIFERSLPGRKVNFQVIQLTNLVGTNEIPPVLGKSIEGHFHYRITITLPQTHRFEGKNTFEVSFYAKADPTPEEVEKENKKLEASRTQPKTVPTPVVSVVEKVEHILDPISTSFIALSFILEEKAKKYSEKSISEGGLIEISILAQDAEEVLGKTDAVILLENHKKWTIRLDDTIEPPIKDKNIEKQLLDIAHNIRLVADEKRRQEQVQQEQEAEQRHYELERGKFVSILDFARGFQFEGKQNGHFEDQRMALIEELRSLGWSLPVAYSGSQVIWRHLGAKVRILYTSKQCTSFVINGEQSELTGSQKKCYEEVAQAFAHIARFFNVEGKERTRMLNREKAIRKETETGAVAYDKLLKEGRARLVLFGPYQGGHGVWSSKFPTEKTPHMLDERVSYNTVEMILEQYPLAELCYRRDLLRINGEVADDASQESIENTSLNITELRQSPRARYILKKRILITLKFEKFSDETDRAPIKHEKNKKEGGVSALDILTHIQEERGVQSISDVTEAFLNYYIDELERNRIRVHYVWPLSARLDEHQARMKKHATKVAV